MASNFPPRVKVALVITTGISAKDRAKTIKIASRKNVKKNDIVSPGHVFPIIAKDGGVLVRAGHTEASVDISRLAKKNNSAVICEIMNEDGTMAKGQDLFNFAKKHKLKIGKIEDLIAYRLKKEKLIKIKKQSNIDVKNQKYKIRIYENLLDGSEHFALIKGNIKKGITPRVRVISSNVVQNYLINQQLPNSFNKTLNYFKKFNNCVLVFIKDTNLKSVTQTLKDYKNKDFYKKGNDKLIRNYGIGAQIIKDLKIKKIVLMPERSNLHIRIEKRFIEMIKNGFLDEVKLLRENKQLNHDLASMRCVGYRQAWNYFEGIYSKKEMVEKAIIATRQLCKRQCTWLRNENEALILKGLETNQAINYLQEHDA